MRDGYVTVSLSTRVSLTMGLEKWSSASPMSMVRSELWVLVPLNNSGLVSKIERTAVKDLFKQEHYGLKALSHTHGCGRLRSFLQPHSKQKGAKTDKRLT